jgi:hypothetical protein
MIPAAGRPVVCDRSQRMCDLSCSPLTVQLGHAPRFTPVLGRKVCAVADAVIEAYESVLSLGFLALYISLTKPPIFETSPWVIAVCKLRYINQLWGQSQILVSKIKVSFLQSW